MLKRLIKVLLSITATAAVITALLIVVAVVGERNPFDSTRQVPSTYVFINNTGEVVQCYRDRNRFAVLTDHNGEILSLQPVSSGLELDKCIEAFKSGTLPFDPRDYIGRYEAGYISWEGFDHESIYDWDVPQECEPHYQFKQKSHPWLVDALDLVDTIEVTFKWTGTDSEWQTCLVARQKRIGEIAPTQIEVVPPDNHPS